MSDQPQSRFLRLNDVLDRTRLSRATLYRKIQEGTFPKQVRIASRCVAWRESDVTEWMYNPMCYQVGEALSGLAQARPARQNSNRETAL